MLNELVAASDAIQRAGIVTRDWHKDLKELPTPNKASPCFRVWLNAGGGIARVEKMDAALVSQLRKFAPDNQNSFPGFNVTKLDSLRRHLTVASKELQERCGGEERLKKEIPVLARLLEIVGKITPEKFFNELTETIRSTNGGLPDRISVVLDVEDYDNNDGWPVAHPKIFEKLNTLLLATPHGNEAMAGRDAFGHDAQGAAELFDKVKIPIIGSVILRAMNKDVPAQTRWRLTGSDSFVAGTVSRRKAKAALEFLSDKERDGSTYGIVGDKELLFAYPRSLSASKISITMMLGAKSMVKSNASGRFADLAKSVISQLQGLGNVAASEMVEIFSLRAMDTARRKVVYYRNTTVADLEAASKQWDAGRLNLPPLSVRDFVRDDKGKSVKGATPEKVEPRTVFPVRLGEHLNAVWSQDGRRLDLDKKGKHKIKCFSPCDGLTLLLDSASADLAARMIGRFMQHAQGYFVLLCRQVGKNEIATSINENSVYLPDREFYLGILGLLLLKLNQPKEQYMNDIPLSLGQLLRVTDELHRQYCLLVRDGNLPPELCGSSLLTAMAESPQMTGAQLFQRAAPYIKWARGGSPKGDKNGQAGLVAWLMKNYAALVPKLRDPKSWPAHLSPPERAQLFLGYLADLPTSEELKSQSQPQPEGNQP